MGHVSLIFRMDVIFHVSKTETDEDVKAVNYIYEKISQGKQCWRTVCETKTSDGPTWTCGIRDGAEAGGEQKECIVAQLNR